MRTFNIKSTILSLIALFFVATAAQAQFDDVYYSASDEAHFVEVEEKYVPETRNDYGYSSFDEDDGYYYTSRIRRFSRPSSSIGYFSPVYTNAYNYGGYTPFGFNNGFVNRSSVFSNNAFAYSRFSNPYITPNNRVFSTFGGVNNINRFGGGGFSNAYYCPPVGGFVTPRAINNNQSTTRNVSNVTSARRSGSVSSSTPRTTTRTTRTARDFRSSTSNSSSVRRTSPRTSTRTNRASSSFGRSSSTRSSSVRSSGSSSRSSSVRSSGSSRGSRG